MACADMAAWKIAKKRRKPGLWFLFPGQNTYNQNFDVSGKKSIRSCYQKWIHDKILQTCFDLLEKPRLKNRSKRGEGT